MMQSRYAGMLDEFSVLAYEQKNPNTIQFLQNRFEQTFANTGNLLTTAGKAFFNASKEAFEFAVGSDAMRFSSSVLRKVKNMFQRNEFRELDTLAEIQQSPQVMHRWLMTEPTMRSLYLDQRCAGFEDTYKNLDGNDIGPDQRDYRLITDGVVRDDEEHGWRQSYYSDAREERPVIDQVNPDMKFTIGAASSLIQHLLLEEGGGDPSSPEGNLL